MLSAPAPVSLPYPPGVQLLGRRALAGGLSPEGLDRRALAGAALTGGRWPGGSGQRASELCRGDSL